MESALRPRDIQARIRAGASPDEVAEAAGVPVERIAAFADGEVYPAHSSRFVLDDSVLYRGSALFAQAVLDYLNGQTIHNK